MFGFLKKFGGPREEHSSYAFSRPLVVLHSDDWGRVGVRDREGFELLRSQGLRLGERPYDLYTLETAEDVLAVVELLGRHHDSSGRSPCLMMNSCVANLDFEKMRNEGFRYIRLLPLAKGLPGSWSRPGLFEAYRHGIAKRLLQPAFHGSLHFSEAAISKALAANGERARLLQTLWTAETPYIFWRMPWIGYEFWNPDERGGGRFLAPDQQRHLIGKEIEMFTQLFGTRPFSACAPGYRSNADTFQIWSELGIQVAVSGTGDGLRAPHMDKFGILHLYRNIDFEPVQQEVDLNKYLEMAEVCFSRGIPLIISIHSINFHSTLKDFRSPSVVALDRLLSALESKYSEMLYANDKDLYQVVVAGELADGSERVKASAAQHPMKVQAAHMGAN